MPGITAAIEAKRCKAERYANEQSRFHVDSFQITMKSEHGDRLIGYDTGAWSCTCDFFAAHDTCSHVMAMCLILGEQAQLQVHADGLG
jgi:hypothetical protein